MESWRCKRTNFSYEIIVSNNASTDNTGKIIQEFATKYPDKFILINHEQNVGVAQNIKNLIKTVRGKYFAILDGDDYWEYDEKLQRQIDFLEKNEDYNGVFHDAKIIVQDEKAKKLLFTDKYLYSQNYNYNTTIFPSDLVKRFVLPSSSMVLRYDHELLISDLWLASNYSIDWKLACLAIRHSKFFFINQPWSVYRNHSAGISKSKKTEFHLSHIVFLKSLLKDSFYKDYQLDLYTSISNEYKILLDYKELEKSKRKKLFKWYVYLN